MALNGKCDDTSAMSQPLVTVIVPVYQVERYLTQCLQSIVSQTYDRLEIWLVDDGSTDGSAQLCDDWAARDSRIHVIHKPNGGLSDARNAALDVMTGDLVMMVDGDDYVGGDCVETLVRVIGDTDSDMAVGQWQMFRDGDSVAPPSSLPGQVKVFTRDQAINKVFYQDTLTNSACSRLFKAALFSGLRFPLGMLYEDLAVAYPLLMRTRRVAYTHHQVYYYRQHPDSITGHFTLQRTQVLDILERLEQQVERENPQFVPAVRSRLLSAYFNIMLLCPDGREFAQVVDRCWDGICRLRWGCLCDGNVRLKNRLGILASWMGKVSFLRTFKCKFVKKY